MGRNRSGIYLNSTGKMFLAAVGAWAGSKIYSNFQEPAAPRRQQHDHDDDQEAAVSEAQRPQYTLVKRPVATPEELEAMREVRIANNYAALQVSLASPKFLAWEAAEAAKVAAKEARIAALHSSGQWRWWMSETLQGWAILSIVMWAIAAPIAWGLSMILTHGDWRASAAHGAASFGYIAVKLCSAVYNFF